MLRLKSLQAENFKRLRLVSIPFKEGVTKLVGKNRAGKSSVLDALAALIGGEKLCPEVPIRRGEDFAEVSADFDDLLITRKWGKGAGLHVKNREGVTQKSPQTLLDKISKRAFDPHAFFTAAPDVQFETLRKLVGVDFAEIDARRTLVYDERTAVNRDVANLKGSLALLAVVNAPDEYRSTVEMLAEQDKIIAEQRRSASLEQAHKDAIRRREMADRRVVDTNNQIAELERQLTATRARLLTEEAAVRVALEVESKAEDACFEPPELDEVRRRLLAVEEINVQVRAKKQRAAEVAKFDAKEKESQLLTKKLEAIDNEKTAMLAKVKFPVPGLSLGRNSRVPTLNGLPLEQASTAEQWGVAVSMGIAQQPDLRLMWIKDGSSIDDESMALIEAAAEAADAQIVIETVAHDGKDRGVGVFIYDGEVLAIDGEKVQPPESVA